MFLKTPTSWVHSPAVVEPVRENRHVHDRRGTTRDSLVGLFAVQRDAGITLATAESGDRECQSKEDSLVSHHAPPLGGLTTGPRPANGEVPAGRTRGASRDPLQPRERPERARAPRGARQQEAAPGLLPARDRRRRARRSRAARRRRRAAGRPFPADRRRPPAAHAPAPARVPRTGGPIRL